MKQTVKYKFGKKISDFMNVVDWKESLKHNRAIAVIRSPSVELAISMAKAVATGGMGLIEITWNSEQPEQIVTQLRDLLPHCLIGVGTILTVEQLKRAIAVGSQFCFTPHTDVHLIETALKADIPIVAGALTPTEIVTAWHAGASCVKVFPIEAVGGITYLRSLKAPLPQIPLIPTGGITLETASDYLNAGAIAVGISGHLFPKDLIEAQNWQAITQNAKRLQQRLTHSQL